MPRLRADSLHAAHVAGFHAPHPAWAGAGGVQACRSPGCRLFGVPMSPTVRLCYRARCAARSRASTPRTAPATIRLNDAIDRPPESVGGIVANPVADALS